MNEIIASKIEDKENRFIITHGAADEKTIIYKPTPTEPENCSDCGRTLIGPESIEAGKCCYCREKPKHDVPQDDCQYYNTKESVCKHDGKPCPFDSMGNCTSADPRYGDVLAEKQSQPPEGCDPADPNMQPELVAERQREAEQVRKGKRAVELPRKMQEGFPCHCPICETLLTEEVEECPNCQTHFNLPANYCEAEVDAIKIQVLTETGSVNTRATNGTPIKLIYKHPNPKEEQLICPDCAEAGGGNCRTCDPWPDGVPTPSLMPPPKPLVEQAIEAMVEGTEKILKGEEPEPWEPEIPKKPEEETNEE